MYRSADGGLHEIVWAPGGGIPAHIDLTAAYAAPPAADRPAAFTVQGLYTQHVAYRTSPKSPARVPAGCPAILRASNVITVPFLTLEG